MAIKSYANKAAYDAAVKPTIESQVSMLETTREILVDGVNVITTEPVPGDLVMLDESNQVRYLKGGSWIQKANIPSTWVHVGYVVSRKGRQVLVVDKTGTDEKYADVVQFKLDDPTLDGAEHTAGIGVRVTLFVSGCTNCCKNCFQPQTWDFNYGREFTEETVAELIDALRPAYVRGLTLLGGEPFEPKNQRVLVDVLRKVREECPGKDIWTFTGFTLDEELLKESYARCEVTDEMLGMIDVLVDGRYVDELRDLALQFRGSSNQRIIDMNRTREAGEIVLWRE